MNLPTPNFWTALVKDFDRCLREGGGHVDLLEQGEVSCRVRITSDDDVRDDDFEGTILYAGEFTGVHMVRAGGFTFEATGPLLYAVAVSGDADWDD